MFGSDTLVLMTGARRVTNATQSVGDVTNATAQMSVATKERMMFESRPSNKLLRNPMTRHTLASGKKNRGIVNIATKPKRMASTTHFVEWSRSTSIITS